MNRVQISKMLILLALFTLPVSAQVGMIQGIITEIPSGNPINGARIGVVDRPWDFVTGPDGLYLIEIPSDSLWIIKVESPPYCLPLWDTIIVSQNDTLIQNYSLEHAIPIILKASFRNPVDASYRSFYIKGSWDSIGVYNSLWTGPYIEIRDDGIAPDQNSRDGVFTGQAWLHPNSHLFSWAIYSENYGGESARLQNGADFQFSNYTPPIVPTLAVNPSGNDNNWGLSVCGTPDLSLDMIRGAQNNPFKWAVAVRLVSGVTYSFKFCVMHSTVASYPIGSPNINFTCRLTAGYDFIFNESDESYIVQLMGTDGPPVALTAQSGLDNHVPLHWFSPGTEIGPEMAYDDGTLADAVCDTNPDHLFGTMFTPTGVAVIESLIVHVLTDGDPYWPYPDNTADPIGIWFFLDNGSGFPQEDPAYYAEAIVTQGQWIRLQIPLVESYGNFWVMVNNLHGGGDEALGMDAFSDFPEQKWARINGFWQNYDLSPGDFMIRVKLRGNFGGQWEMYSIYRDINPQPYYSMHQIANNIMVPGEFDDWGEDIYGPIINGVTYYYQVSAVYDIGGGQFIEVGPSNQATATPMDHSCRYVPGDINSDSVFSGLDVSFMVTYFRGGARPAYICDCPPDSNWFIAGDVNGNCAFNGLDVTYSVAYFKGGPAPVPCPDCPPEAIFNGRKYDSSLGK